MNTNRPIMKERYLNMEEVARQVDRLTQPQGPEVEMAEAAVKQKEYFISALKKKKENKPLSDYEVAALVDYSTNFVDGETRQQEALEAYQQQVKNQQQIDKARDRVLLKGREYE